MVFSDLCLFSTKLGPAPWPVLRFYSIALLTGLYATTRGVALGVALLLATPAVGVNES